MVGVDDGHLPGLLVPLLDEGGLPLRVQDEFSDRLVDASRYLAQASRAVACDRSPDGARDVDAFGYGVEFEIDVEVASLGHADHLQSHVRRGRDPSAPGDAGALLVREAGQGRREGAPQVHESSSTSTAPSSGSMTLRPAWI